MKMVAGVDACKAGWLCVLLDAETGTPHKAFIMKTIAEVAALDDVARIAIDIPIGLPERTGPGGRGCDAALRDRLGPRKSSVFSIPARHATYSDVTYPELCHIARQHSDPPRAISIQCFHILLKIREVDMLMTRELQQRFVECHPEGCFWAMNGGKPLTEGKKRKSRPNRLGLEMRRRLLEIAGFPRDFLTERRFRAAEAGEDDLLDACACAWTARRVLRGEAWRFPDEPMIDPRGLRMEIWA
jgi:predicted RNase H-like nuclease